MLEVRGVSKAFGGVHALRDAGITVHGGSVHALLGENGAGKSTLIKIITGAVRPDRGSLSLEDRPASFTSTADAAAHGVAVVSQELNQFPDLDVLANLYPMREPRRGPFLSRATMWARAEPVLAQLGLDVDPRAPLGQLSLAERQLVEIAKALLTEPKVLILDEPTSALEAASTERLLGIVRTLRERSVAVVFVSHLLEEVMTLCDEITVLREGRTVLAGVPRAELDMAAVVTAMLGRPQRATAARPAGTQPERPQCPQGTLRFTDVTVPGRLSGVTFTASQGEVVGLAGLAGSGHSTVLEVVAGLRRPTGGAVRLPGDRPAPRRLRAAIAAGVAVVSGDRRRLGLMLDKPVWENIAQVRSVALARDGHLVRPGPLRRRSAGLAARLGIRAPHPDVPSGLLSGGNQQKVVLAKWLQAEPEVILLDDPTRGVGIGSKQEIYGLLRDVADSAVTLLSSTDLDEFALLCDRVLVFHRNRLCATLCGGQITPHTILHTMNTGEQVE